MTGIDIRLAQPDDRLKLVELQRRASLASETGEVLQRLLEEPELIDVDAELIAQNRVLVATRGDQVLGFATILTREGDDAELDGLFVEPDHWRQGIGRQLLHAIEREAAAWGANRLHVLANVNAVPFYDALGFARLGEQKTRLGPVAWLMAKPVLPLT